MVTAADVKKNADTIIAQYYAQKAALNAPAPVVNPFDKDPPKNIRGFKRTIQGAGDSTLTAADIGNLTQGKTRLTVLGALPKGDAVDFFQFTATAKEKLGIAVTTDKGVSIQILDGRGRVIADSEAKYGDKHDNFLKAGAQNLDITKGQYYIKVTRPPGTLNSVTPNYAIQVSTTKYYTEDYDTTKKPAARVSYGSTNALSGSSLNDLLVQTNPDAFNSGNGTYYNKKI